MTMREPIRAGSFYSESPEGCREDAMELLEIADVPMNLPDNLYGGIVPHAGWVYSGRIAARTLKCLNQVNPLQTVVLLGADHTGVVELGEVYHSGSWITPMGQLTIDTEAAAAVLAEGKMLRPNEQAHAYEHSIEIQIPMLQVLCPDVQILPIAVPPTSLAVDIGTAIATALLKLKRPFAIVGSTDLTHHGGHFPSPGGYGETGVQYAVDNDERMIALIKNMDARQVILEAQHHHNACGAGAIAAAISACHHMGATRGRCLEYTNSYEITRALSPNTKDYTTVGYASIIFE